MIDSKENRAILIIPSGYAHLIEIIFNQLLYLLRRYLIYSLYDIDHELQLALHSFIRIMEKLVEFIGGVNRPNGPIRPRHAFGFSASFGLSPFLRYLSNHLKNSRCQRMAFCGLSTQ